jgi:hypothetical protein
MHRIRPSLVETAYVLPNHDVQIEAAAS